MTVQTIQQFIDKGWYTVPLGGKLTRLANGKKTLPVFPSNWNTKFAKEFNKDDAELGGVITGIESAILAIDCDNTVTYQLFTSLDSNYKFHFISRGKKDGLGTEQKAGTIIYKYVPALSESFHLHNAMLSLDYYAAGGFIYLPTSANETKEPFEWQELKEPPKEIIALLQSLKPVRVTLEDKTLRDKSWSNNLAPQLSAFVLKKKVIPNLFKTITPKDFRDLPEYISKKYLHPDEVPDGRGSEYLSKVSAILGADKSVDVDLYMSSMHLINDLFSTPMPKTQLFATILEPMVEERASIDGAPIWRYDENWADHKLTVMTKRNECLDTFYDPDRMLYYMADVLAERTKVFNRETDFQTHLETVALEAPPKKEIKNRLPLVNVVSTPSKPYGFFADDYEQAFNSFSPSIPLSIFKNPVAYEGTYRRPAITLQFLESLVPDNYMRNYLLRFLRRKFDKFEYSPVTLYFLGVPGAGKDTIVKLIELFIGPEGMARPTTKEFLELYNGWMLDKYFVQLDEYGNQLVRFDDKEIALGKLKAYTGKAQVQIRQMRTDGFPYMHNITFIATANKNPLMLESDDRRIALFDCPNSMSNMPWVQALGGASTVVARLDEEINDFAYYLATEVDNLSLHDYTTPPESDDKLRLIASKFDAAKRLAFLFKSKLFKEVEDLATEFGVPKVFRGAWEGRVYEEDLFDLYYEMTEGNGTARGLASSMKEFTKVPTTKDGMKAYYYDVPKIREYRSFKPFNEIEET